MGEKIKFSNAIFGYSMLYPYTDNYLDNREYFTENYINQISRYLPFKLEYCSDLRKRLSKIFSKLSQEKIRRKFR